MCSNLIVSTEAAAKYGTPVFIKTPEGFRTRKKALKESNERAKKKLLKASLLTTIFIIMQLTGALLAGSIALMTDTAHLATDILGFAISVSSLFIS